MPEKRDESGASHHARPAGPVNVRRVNRPGQQAGRAMLGCMGDAAAEEDSPDETSEHLQPSEDGGWRLRNRSYKPVATNRWKDDPHRRNRLWRYTWFFCHEERQWRRNGKRRELHLETTIIHISVATNDILRGQRLAADAKAAAPGRI